MGLLKQLFLLFLLLGMTACLNTFGLLNKAPPKIPNGYLDEYANGTSYNPRTDSHNGNNSAGVGYANHQNSSSSNNGSTSASSTDNNEQCTPKPHTQGWNGEFSQEQKQKLIRYIGEKEFNNDPKDIVGWNEKENFASLGLGHYIIYPPDTRTEDKKFRESFPDFLFFLQNKTPPINVPGFPVDLESKSIGQPWKNKSEFETKKSAGELDELIKFLNDRKDLQIEFQVEQLKTNLQRIVDYDFSQEENLENYSTQDKRKSFVEALQSSPEGFAALTHYATFKGTGLPYELNGQTVNRERYTVAGDPETQYGWGLLSVIDAAAKHVDLNSELSSEEALELFQQSAQERLDHRADKGDNVDDSKRSSWKTSWRRAISGYGCILDTK